MITAPAAAERTGRTAQRGHSTMAQGYPQGSYGQQPNPYPQPPNPYQPNPYQPQQSYGQQPPQPYAQPEPPQYARSPYAAGAAPGPPRWVPEEAGDVRRGLGALLDTLAAAVAGFVAANAAQQHGWAGGYFGALVVVAIGFSFVNQVVLGRLVGCSLGKFVTVTRVIRFKDVSRPLTGRLTRRWLLGFVMVIGLLVDEFPESEEACGVRTVRWRHLRAARLG